MGRFEHGILRRRATNSTVGSAHPFLSSVSGWTRAFKRRTPPGSQKSRSLSVTRVCGGESRMLRLEQLQDSVRTLTHLVADGDLSGLFVIGPGGLGKTHAIRAALEERGVTPGVFNAHASPYGLYCEFYHRRKERVLLLDDLEQIYTSLPCLSLLRAALWGMRDASGAMVRTVSWTSPIGKDDEVPASFQFHGGLIMTANRVPKRSEIFESLRTRVATVKFDVGAKDVFLFMRRICRGGRQVFDSQRGETVRIAEDECAAVIDFLELKEATDLRMLDHALVLWNRHGEGDQWKRLLEVILASAPRASREKRRRQSEDELVEALLDDVSLSGRERVERYQEATGKSRASFFRRQRRLR